MGAGAAEASAAAEGGVTPNNFYDGVLGKTIIAEPEYKTLFISLVHLTAPASPTHKLKRLQKHIAGALFSADKDSSSDKGPLLSASNHGARFRVLLKMLFASKA